MDVSVVSVVPVDLVGLDVLVGKVVLRGSPYVALKEGRASGPAPLRATLSCPPTAELLAPTKRSLKMKKQAFRPAFPFYEIYGARTRGLHRDRVA